MNNEETSNLLAVIKTAYPEFEITAEVIRLWHLFLQDITYNGAMINLKSHIATSRFAPRIADLLREDLQRPLSIYEVQRLEQEQQLLELQEYHQNEDAKPMPERIAKQLQEFFSKAKVNADES